MTSISERGGAPIPLREQQIPQPELYPDPELVREHMVGVTVEAAIAVSEAISQFTPVEPGVSLSKRDKKIRVELLDTLAASRFEDYLRRVPFRVESVASEGEKEWEKLGRGMPTVLGIKGFGEKAVTIANDVVEGTTAASHNRPGAISVLSASTYGGIMPSPDGVNYMEKLFGPPEVAGMIDIENRVEDNLDIVCSVFRVPPREVKVVAMNRKTNAGIIERANRFGADVTLIEAGDLVPSLLAVTSPNKHGRGIYLVMGRGGMEEGIIAAAGAKAQGSHAQGRIWVPLAEDKDLPAPNGRVLGLEELIPGRREHSLVAFTTITDDPWFEFPGTKFNGTISGQSVLLDQQGFHVIPFERDINGA